MGGGPPGFPPDSSCPAVLWYLLGISSFDYRAVTVSGPAFLRGSSRIQCRLWRPATPWVRRPLVWPLPASLAATEGIDLSFFSSGYLDVSVPRVPSCETMDSSHGDGALPPPGFPIRISPDLRPLTAPRGFSQLATSFVGNQCHWHPPCALVRLICSPTGRHKTL